MTRVLFLAERVELPDDGEPAPHGSAAHTAATLAGLRASFEVLALGGEAPKPPTPAALRRARRLVPARVRGARQDLLALRADRRFAERALERARAFVPDVVYERGEYLVGAGATVADRLGIPLVREVNGLFEEEVRTMYRSLLEPLGTRGERCRLLRAAALVVESPGMADALVARGVPRDRLAVVPNSVSPDRLRSAPRQADPDRAVVTWMGHLMPWHRDALSFLLEAARPIVMAAPQVRFAIFGGGPGMAELAGRAPASFDFHGVVPHAELALWLEQTDIAVVPEMPPHKLPVKIVEFGAAGLPLVAPAGPSLDAQLEPHVEYQPFVRGDRDSLASAVLALVQDPGLRQRLGAGLHGAVRDRFTWDATAARLREVVERIL